MDVMNRIGVTQNPYQGDYRKVLFLCTAGCLRSPTAMIVAARETDWNVRCAGTDPNFSIIPCDEVLLHWADDVVVMQDHHYQDIKDTMDAMPNTYRPTVHNFNLEDCHAFMSEPLVEEIKTQLDYMKQNDKKEKERDTQGV